MPNAHLRSGLGRSGDRRIYQPVTDLAERPLTALSLPRTVHATPFTSVEVRHAKFGQIAVLAGPRGGVLRGAAALLRSGDKVLLTRETRHGVRAQLVQTPGGAIDRGETAQDAAARELAEESGYAAAALTGVDLGAIYPYAPYVDARTHLLFFRADDIAPSSVPCGELDELLWAPIGDAIAAAVDGTIRCATTVTLILRAHARGLLD